MCLVDIVQHMWRTWEIPPKLGQTVLVLIPKETTTTQGIGLLETLWKVVEAMIDSCLRASLQLHDVLNGFRDGRRTGMAIMELKLSQELTSIYQDSLFLVFLDLKKAYDTMDQERPLITPEGCGVGPRLCGLLETFWGHQQVVPKQNGFHGPALPATQGTTQGGLVLSTLFNVVVDNVIKTWLAMTVENQRVYHDGLGVTIRRCLGVFYANDCMVVSRDADLLQHAINVMVGLFQRYGLAANVAKSCTMTYQPGALRLGMSTEANALKCLGWLVLTV